MTTKIRTSGVTLTDRPLIMWDSVVTTTNVSAESDPDFPATNVANPGTALKWKHDATDSPETAVEYFRIDVSQSDLLSCVAVFGHNFSSAGIAVGLELATWSSPVGGADSTFDPQIPPDDGPLIFIFPAQEIEDARLVLVTGSAPAEITIIYAGQYLVMPQGISPDHTPLPMGNVADISTGMSESGAFLGRVVKGDGLVSTASIDNLEEAFAVGELLDFLSFAEEFPFFWAWAPNSYPDQTALAWLDNDAQPVRDVDGYWSVELQMRGLA